MSLIEGNKEGRQGKKDWEQERGCYNLKLSGQGKSGRKCHLSNDVKEIRDIAVKISQGRLF